MSFSAPLPPVLPLLPGEDPHHPAALAPELASTARNALAMIRADLQLLAGCDLAPALLELAQEIHGTAAQLLTLAERLEVEAAPPA